MLLAALGHAMVFQTWRSLVRQQNLSSKDPFSEVFLDWDELDFEV